MDTKNPTLAEKLAWLFANVRKADGSRYTQAEVVEGAGGALTRVYLWKLRTGKAVNPSFHIIQALAAFFQVDPGYFAAAEKQDSEAQELPGREPGDAAEMVDRFSELDVKGQKIVLDLVNYLLENQRNRPGRRL
jgi:transcriptional regulator with XRE-family HTH domain